MKLLGFMLGIFLSIIIIGTIIDSLIWGNQRIKEIEKLGNAYKEGNTSDGTRLV